MTSVFLCASRATIIIKLFNRSRLVLFAGDPRIVTTTVEHTVNCNVDKQCKVLGPVYVNLNVKETEEKQQRQTRGQLKKNLSEPPPANQKKPKTKDHTSPKCVKRLSGKAAIPVKPEKRILKTLAPTQLFCQFQGCERVYTSPYLYDSHVKTHIPKHHVCEICQKVFSKMSVLKRHLLTHSTDRPYSCDVCLKRFKTIFTFDYHRKVAHTDAHKKFACDRCDYSTVSAHNLKVHIRRHEGQTEYVCEVCGKGAYTKAELESHKAIHTDEKHTCLTCGKDYASRRYLYLHQEIHKEVRIKPFVCEICGRSFRYKNKLKGHMLAHSGQERRYQCEVCGTSVNSQTYLKIHKRTHTGEKPYSCNVCFKAFNAHNYLKVHMRSHTGEKPYLCMQCNKSFTQRSTLVVHMRFHTGVKPYQCMRQGCEKSFATRTLLNSHEKSHCQ